MDIPDETKADLLKLMNDDQPRDGWQSAMIPCSYLFALAKRAGDVRLYDALQDHLASAGWRYEITFDAWTKREAA